MPILIKSVIKEIKRRTSLRKVPTINVGSLTGSVFPSENGPVIAISIKPTFQDIFESDLRILLDILKCMKTPVTLIFSLGGTLLLPDWFTKECEQLDIHIPVIEEEKRIPILLETLFPEYDL